MSDAMSDAMSDGMSNPNAQASDVYTEAINEIMSINVQCLKALQEVQKKVSMIAVDMPKDKSVETPLPEAPPKRQSTLSLHLARAHGGALELLTYALELSESIVV